MLTLLHSETLGGVTFCHVLPASFVTCMFPSSVPAQIRPSRTCDGAIARIVPSACFGSFSLTGVRVKSWPTASQLVPASVNEKDPKQALGTILAIAPSQV